MGTVGLNQINHNIGYKLTIILDTSDDAGRVTVLRIFKPCTVVRG